MDGFERMLNEMRSEMGANEDVKKDGQKHMRAEIKAGQDETRAAIIADKEQMRTNMKAGQGKIENVVRVDQENTDTTMSAIRCTETELEETIDKLVEGVLASVNKWIRSLHEELDCEIQRIRLYMQAAKPLVEGTRRELEMQL
jgi:hypothetical protein